MRELNQCYLVYSTYGTWQAGQEYCKSIQGNLFTFDAINPEHPDTEIKYLLGNDAELYKVISKSKILNILQY